MIRFIELSGVRLLERSLLSEDRSIIPGGLSPVAFANQIANVHFGITDSGLFGECPQSDAEDAAWLEHEARTERAKLRLKGDHLASPEDIIVHFFSIGFDLNNDERRLAASASYFTRIIEAGSLGWLSPFPCKILENWRRGRMAAIPLHAAANDDHIQWVSRYGSIQAS